MVERAWHEAQMADLERGDRVITPSDEVARVVEVGRGAHVQLEYRDALVPEHAALSLPVSLCALWAHDKPRPRPIRKR